MLEQVNLHAKATKDSYKKEMKELGLRLGKVQRLAREQEKPVIILFEGWRGCHRNEIVSELMQYVDGRGFAVDSTARVRPQYRRKPFFTYFWHHLPAKGDIRLYMRSWYYLKNLTEELALAEYDIKPVDYGAINRFEQELAADGYVILKFFLHLSQERQAQNLQEEDSYIGKDWLTNALNDSQAYERYYQLYDGMLQATDTAEVPWHLISVEDLRAARLEIFATICDSIEKALEQPVVTNETGGARAGYDILSTVNPQQAMTKEEYKKEFKACRKELRRLQMEMYERGISTIIGFEGWDAGGKGGAIRRLTASLDPWAFAVYPVAAPNVLERDFHYLWRFWRHIPDEAGFVGIFDRTWYGRVMVERVEGFAQPREWQRAYEEINDMEAQWAAQNYCVVKFWLQIDKEEQLARFTKRQSSPEKQWKITEEDWRNREKWEAYETAVNEMLARTDKPHAPWVIVEGNNKYYARIKVMRTVASLWQQKLAELQEK